MRPSSPPLSDPVSVDEALRFLLWARELPAEVWDQLPDNEREAICNDLDLCPPVVTTWVGGIRKSSSRYHGEGRMPERA